MIQVQGKAIQETVSQTREKRLQKFLDAAKEYQKRNDIFRLALCVKVIYSEKLYLEGDYKDIYDLGKKALNIQRGTVSNYMTVAKKFLDSNTGYSVFKQGDKDFKFMQLLEMKKLTVEEIKGLLDSGAITLDSTAKDIKALMQERENQKKKQAEQEKAQAVKPLKDAYENFHVAFNELKYHIQEDEKTKELLQKIMDSVVFLYNENDRLWGG